MPATAPCHTWKYVRESLYVVKSVYWPHTWRTNQCFTFQLEVAALVLSHFSWRWGPSQWSPGRGSLCGRPQSGQGTSLNGVFLLKMPYIYPRVTGALSWFERRSQWKVIPCGDLPIWWNGVQVPHTRSQLNRLANQNGKALRPITKISPHSGVTFLFSCSGVP